MQLLPDPPGSEDSPVCAAGKNPCNSGTTKCSAAEVIETVGCRAPLFAGGFRSNVCRKRFQRLSADQRIRGHSSAGRAPALQAGGRRFDPGWLHQLLPSRPPAPRDVASSCKPTIGCLGSRDRAEKCGSAGDANERIVCSLTIRRSFCFDAKFSSER